MNIYSKKQRWKLFLLLIAILIGVGSLYYTNELVKKLAAEEKKKVELWAEATKLLVDENTSEFNYGFLLKVLENNETVPVIVTDSNDRILFSRNLDTTKVKNQKYLLNRLSEMKKENEPIKYTLPGNIVQYLYYDKSTLLKKLIYYPYIQLAVILLFIVVSYLAFSASRKAEQNKVWVGLSKETAHQLGTPTSSLMAWVEILKSKDVDQETINELEKDVQRLNKITERFSKIGSKPKLVKVDVIKVLNNAVEYIKSRSSDKIVFKQNFSDNEILVPLNVELFEWVIESLCKNAIDAMEGEGTMEITVTDNTQVLYIDIADTGKGIPKTKFKTIFKPGYTTKDRGWGLGLSLTERIIEMYHDGKIFVNMSEVGKGTIFRVVLKKI